MTDCSVCCIIRREIIPDARCDNLAALQYFVTPTLCSWLHASLWALTARVLPASGREVACAEFGRGIGAHSMIPLGSCGSV
jgi:hypothetical protein